MTTPQHKVINLFINKFREAYTEVSPDWTYADKERKMFTMTREQLEDFAERSMKVAFEKFPSRNKKI